MVASSSILGTDTEERLVTNLVVGGVRVPALPMGWLALLTECCMHHDS